MTWNEWGELAKAVAPLLTAFAAWTGTITGLVGLEKWRSESLGKRKAEVAETTLANVYEMEEILKSARSPLVLAHEMSKKINIPDHIATKYQYTPEARLLEHQEFFGKFRSQKYLFAALFGKDASEAIDGLWQCRVEINAAVNAMLKLEKDTRGNAVENYQSEFYNIAFSSADKEKDKLGERISNHVKVIESICRPAIDARAKS